MTSVNAIIMEENILHIFPSVIIKHIRLQLGDDTKPVETSVGCSLHFQ